MDAKAIETKHSEQCKSVVATFKRELQKVRTGRASPGLLEGIHVEYYGNKTALNHMAQVSAPEPRVLLVQVYDSSAVQSVEKAISSSGLNLNPSREGNTLRIVIPPLTEETRKELVRHLSKLSEEMRVQVRNHRRDANEQTKKLEKDSILTQDDSKRLQERIQKQTDQYITELDALLKHKEKEVMEV